MSPFFPSRSRKSRATMAVVLFCRPLSLTHPSQASFHSIQYNSRLLWLGPIGNGDWVEEWIHFCSFFWREKFNNSLCCCECSFGGLEMLFDAQAKAFLVPILYREVIQHLAWASNALSSPPINQWTHNSSLTQEDSLRPWRRDSRPTKNRLSKTELQASHSYSWLLINPHFCPHKTIINNMRRKESDKTTKVGKLRVAVKSTSTTPEKGVWRSGKRLPGPYMICRDY
jgi:hypothetical protein